MNDTSSLWSPPTPASGKGARARQLRTIGGVLVAFGVVTLPIAFIGVLASANSCGMFADGCGTYGKPVSGAGWWGLLLFVGFLALVGGIATRVVAWVQASNLPVAYRRAPAAQRYRKLLLLGAAAFLGVRILVSLWSAS